MLAIRAISGYELPDLGWQTLRLAWADFTPYRLQGVLDAARVRRIDRIGLVAIGEPGAAELCLGRLAVW